MRRWIGPIVSLGLLLLVHPASAGPAGVTSWSQVGRDTTHTAYNPTESVLSPATVPDLVEQWRAELGGDHFSTPVVDGSLVFQTSYDNGALSAFDRSTGTLVWQVVHGQRDPFNTPAVADGKVFATVDASDPLYALDEATGEVLWTLGMEGSSGAPPSVVTEGGVTTVFAVGGSTVYAVDGATGTVHWSDDLGFFTLQATPAVANGVVYVVDHEPVLHAYDMETGEENWAAPLGPDNDTPSYPVLDNGMVVVALWGGVASSRWIKRRVPRSGTRMWTLNPSRARRMGSCTCTAASPLRATSPPSTRRPANTCGRPRSARAGHIPSAPVPRSPTASSTPLRWVDGCWHSTK